MGPQLGRRMPFRRAEGCRHAVCQVAQREDAQRAEGLGCKEEQVVAIPRKSDYDWMASSVDVRCLDLSMTTPLFFLILYFLYDGLRLRKATALF
jgi:hypothetical protein